jgi:hypothetical protein
MFRETFMIRLYTITGQIVTAISIFTACDKEVEEAYGLHLIEHWVLGFESRSRNLCIYMSALVSVVLSCVGRGIPTCRSPFEEASYQIFKAIHYFRFLHRMRPEGLIYYS